MLKQVKISFLLFAVAGFLVSCNNDSDVRDEALNNLEANAVAPGDAAAAPEQAQGQEVEVPAGPLTTIEFKENEFDYGKIPHGEKASHVYTFTNTGTEPLVISSAKASCGCTVPTWPKEPIPPGGTGEIPVEFDSKGKSGKQNKKVTITANTNPPQTFLYFKGDIEGGPTPEGGAVQVQ